MGAINTLPIGVVSISTSDGIIYANGGERNAALFIWSSARDFNLFQAVRETSVNGTTGDRSNLPNSGGDRGHFDIAWFRMDR